MSSFAKIGAEARSKSIVPSDVDDYRYKYNDSERQSDNTNIDICFVSPVFAIFERNKFYLLENSEKIAMKPLYRYRPDYVSYERYGTTNWWQLILWLNNIKSIEYFDKDFIIVPSSDAIHEIMDHVFDGGDYIDINEDAKHKQIDSTLFMPPINNLGDPNAIKEPEVSIPDSVSNDDEEGLFCRENFTMDIPILRLKYVELKHVPIKNSVRLTAKCKSNLIYGKHYVLTQGTDKKLNRISWDAKDVKNTGLLFKLKENDILEVQYVRNID